MMRIDLGRTLALCAIGVFAAHAVDAYRTTHF